MTPLQRILYRTSLVVIAVAALSGVALLLLGAPQPAGVRLVTEHDAASTPSFTSSPTATAVGAPRLVNINTASAPELEELPRIGEVLAERIVEYRAANGSFMRLDHIMAVRGIGPATYEAVRELITVGEP